MCSWRGNAHGVYGIPGTDRRNRLLRCVAAPCLGGLLVIVPTTVTPDHEVGGARYSADEVLRAIQWYADQYHVDPLLLRAVIKAESDFRQDARSRKGAMGLMQLMPGTASTYHVADPYDAVQNIRAGARQLGRLLRLYDGDVALAVAAYNAGVHRVKRHQIPRIRETRRYVDKVLRYYHEVQGQQAVRDPAGRSENGRQPRDAVKERLSKGAQRPLNARGLSTGPHPQSQPHGSSGLEEVYHATPHRTL